MAKRFSKCPPLVGEFAKELYVSLEEMNSDFPTKDLIDTVILNSLEVVSKKKGIPVNYLIGQIVPAASVLMGDAEIKPHDVINLKFLYFAILTNLFRDILKTQASGVCHLARKDLQR